MKEIKRKLPIPTTRNTREYFEACLRLSKIQCPNGDKRKTSGGCPFYFAGGACRECIVCDSEPHNIIQAWTRAIAAAGSKKAPSGKCRTARTGRKA